MGLSEDSRLPLLLDKWIWLPFIAWLLRPFSIGSDSTLVICFPSTGCSETICSGNGERKPNVIRLRVLKPIALCLHLLLNFKMGLAESYVDGAWTAEPSPKEFLSFLIRAKRRRSGGINGRGPLTFATESKVRSLLSTFLRSLLVNVPLLWRHLKQAFFPAHGNTASRSLRNAKAHYDLGNDLFRLFLDPSMTYSCALFDDVQETKTTGPWSASLLYDAQMRKYDAMLDLLGSLRVDQSVLEIGSGWGAFAIRAVHRFGCKWTGLTLSEEQLRFAKRRVEEEGLADTVELKLMDYRQENNCFDHIVAVEMIEAVGHEFLPIFFAKCNQLLRPGGKLCLQAILCRDQNYERYRNSTDFIRKHIFPGGHLPSLGAIRAALPRGMRIAKVSRMDEHYALTLDIWRSFWLKNRSPILVLNKCEKFYRKWDMYFSLCSALFEHNSVFVAQILIKKTN